jgi:hypothetical protein
MEGVAHADQEYFLGLRPLTGKIKELGVEGYFKLVPVLMKALAMQTCRVSLSVATIASRRVWRASGDGVGDFVAPFYQCTHEYISFVSVISESKKESNTIFNCYYYIFII